MVNKKEKLQNAVEDFEQKTEKSVEDYMTLFQTFFSVTQQGSGLVWSQIKEVLEVALHEVTPDTQFYDWEKGILRRLVSERVKSLSNSPFTRNEDVYQQLSRIHERIRIQDVEDVIFLKDELWMLKCLVSEKYHEEIAKDAEDLNLNRHQELCDLHRKFEQIGPC